MLFAIIALLIWSSSFVAAKYVYTMLDPILLVQARLLIAALLVLPGCLKYLPRLNKQQRKKLMFLAFFNYTLSFLLQFTGLKFTSAASAVTVIGLEPLMMVFVGHFFYGDKAKAYHWLCGLAAFVGVALMIGGGGESGGQVSWLGCSLIFLAGIVFCCVLRPTQRFIQEIGAPAYTSVSLLFAAIACLPFTAVLTQDWTPHWNLSGSLALLYMGVGCSWLAFVLWNKGITQISANLSGLLTALEPLFGLLMAVLLLGEHISALSGLGMLVVLLATLLAALLPLQHRFRQPE